MNKMKQEIKIRIKDIEAIEKKIKEIGGSFVQEEAVLDTYLKQPKGEVLKIVEDSSGAFVMRLQQQGDGFVILYKKEIKNVDVEKKKCGEVYGVKVVQKKIYRLFSVDDYTININTIEGVGSFLIISSETVDPKTLLEELDITKPDFITVPFCDL
jgi:adenylate cyclase class IV